MICIHLCSGQPYCQRLVAGAIVSSDGQADGRRSEAISWAAPRIAGTKQSKAKAISLGKRGAQTSARPQTKQDNFPLDNCQEDKYQGRPLPALVGYNSLWVKHRLFEVITYHD